MEYVTVIIRTVIFYVLITLVYRFMGKREIGELGIVDLIVSILIAELAAISIDNLEDSIFLSVIPILLLVGIQIGMAKVSLKNGKIRNVFDGEPSVMINRGKVNFSEMIKQRYNLDDLLTQLREKGIKSIEEVEYAVLETSGRLSVFPKDKSKNSDYPLAVILDGKIQEDTLSQIKKTRKWLLEMLVKEKVELKEIFYGFYREKKLFIIKNSDLIKK